MRTHLVTECKLGSAFLLKGRWRFLSFSDFLGTILILKNITHVPHCVSYLSEEEPQFLDHHCVPVTDGNTSLTFVSSVCLDPALLYIEIESEI